MQIEGEDRDMKQTIFKFYKYYKTICEMMLDRGYFLIGAKAIEDRIQELEEMGPEGLLEEFKNEFSNLQIGMNTLYMFSKENGEPIYVHFIQGSITLDFLQRTFKKVEHGSDDVILVVNGDYDKKTNNKSSKLFDKDQKQVKSGMDQLIKQNHLEVLNENDLVYNITRHNLVPTHVKLSPEEKDQLLKKYKIGPNQLPKISVNDPVSKYFGMKREDVFKIVRTSETAGKYITYRICS